MLLLAGAYGLSSGSVAGVGGVIVFAPLLAIGPLLALSQDNGTPSPLLLAALASAGVAGALAIALNDYLVLGESRAGVSAANPIHFADVALAAGFLSLIGVVFLKGPARFVFLSSPVLAAVAVTLSGTRGAMLAFVLMAAAAAALAGALRLVRPRTFLAAGALAIGILALGLASGLAETSGVQRVLTDIADVLQTGLPTDNSTAIRLSMYQGGLDAFLGSPLVGHGPFAFVEAAAQTQVEQLFVGSPHLHSDLFDFAASAGIFGLLSYALFLFAPLVEALRAPSSSSRNGLIVIAAALTIGYFVMGLTNAMFGILTVTTYFAAICVVIGLLGQNQAPVASATVAGQGPH